MLPYERKKIIEDFLEKTIETTIDENYVIMEKKNQLTEIYKNIISPDDLKDKDQE